MRLKGKTAVVTGGTRGIGRQIVDSLLAQGCRVMYSARAEPVDDEVADTGGDSAFQRADVRDPASVDRLMRSADELFGGLDIVVANAGVSRPGGVDALSTQDWQETIETDLTGVFHCVHAAVPHLERRGCGRIVTISSALATRATAGASAYCSAKAAVEMFTKVCAIELASRGITVNCVSPGFVDIGMGRELAGNERVWPQYEPKLAMGRLGTPDEVAAAVLFLVSREGAYVNGHVLEVNGGLRW